jgi:Domain of unknown function (DUF6089)
MTKRMLVLVTLVAAVLQGEAQMQSTVVNGEFGISAGMAHYFGDLNTRAQVNKPKPSVGAYFRKSFGNYIGLRVGAHFAQLGYSDVYSKNEFQKTRNLSFNTNLWQLTLQGDFHFFKFIPGEPGYGFTPYLTFGVGAFNYDPYAYLQGKKIFLRPLNTEGQNTTAFPDRKPYSTMAITIPFGMGIKYNLNDRVNLTFEITHHFTTTDYLDDVSKTYAGGAAFPPGPGGIASDAFLLQDRSYEYGDPIGAKGKQRGWSKQKDQYLFAEIGVSFSLTSYKCPDPGR